MNTLGIRRRIRSVKNVRQITKAMELTAAAKMHRASQAVLGARPYANRALELARNLATRSTGTHALLDIRPIKAQLMILITTDRGLAGGLNNQLLRHIALWYKNHTSTADFILIGKKGTATLAKLGVPVIAQFNDLPSSLNSIHTRPISLLAKNQFLAKKYDVVYIAYNHFQSTLVQKPTVRQILPLVLHPEQTAEQPVADENKATDREIVFEPDPTSVLDGLLPRLFDQAVYQMVLESRASEHAARMVAMRNATDNAGELLDDLELTFNGIRQATITAEMAEISASIAALE